MIPLMQAPAADCALLPPACCVSVPGYSGKWCRGRRRYHMAISERTSEVTEVERFYDDLEANGLQGLWRVTTQTPEPRTAAVPYVWPGDMLRRQLMRAGELMTMDRSAERRVLLLVNP